jgi:hypothetical protein
MVRSTVLIFLIGAMFFMFVQLTPAIQAGQTARYDFRLCLLTATGVSQGARILFGVLAGANQLAVQVDVFETASRNLVASFTAKEESASHPLSSESDMNDAIREAVDEVILELNS